MKQKCILAASIFTFMVGFPYVVQAKSNWYLGAQYSAQELNRRTDVEHKTAGVIGGYQYNQYLALETRFNKGVSGYSSPLSPEQFGDFRFKEDIDYQSSLLLKVTYPIATSFGLYALVGGTKSRYEMTGLQLFLDENDNVTNYTPYKSKHTETGLSYGVGMNYQFNESINVFIDYQALPDFKPYPRQSARWRSINFGVTYTF